MVSILIVGGGKAGSALAYHFLNNNIRIISLIEVDPQRIQFLEKHLHWEFINRQINPRQIHDADIIFLAVNDNQIEKVALQLSGIPETWEHKMVLHLSGALPAKSLRALRTKGAHTASLHPIYSFATDPQMNPEFQDCWFTLEGDSIKPGDLEQKLALKPDRIIQVNSLQKQAVHVASVFYANFFMALADMSLEILKNSGAFSSESLHLFQPLILSAIENITKSGPAGALTGPVSRGDSKTLKQHLSYLEKHHPGLKEAYRMLGKRLVKVSNLSKKEKQEIIELLNLP